MSSAQYCGNSGTGQCTPNGILTTPGFTASQDIPCIIRGQLINQVIEFSMAPSVNWGPLYIWRFDSIENLPDGLCWSTDRPNNTYDTLQSGCIKIAGVTNALSGQYKLRITGTITTQYAPFQTEIEAVGFNATILLRVIDQSSLVCPPVTSQDSFHPFIPFTGNYQNVAQISGKMFFDVNQNQVFDSGEQPVRNQLLNIGNNYVALTTQTGNYTVYPTAGIYSVTPTLTGNIAGFIINPSSIVVHADSIGIDYQNNNFAVIPPSDYCDGSITILAVNPPPRPGFNNTLAVKFTNLFSASTVSQNVRFYYSNEHIFVSSNPSATLVDTVNRFIEWSVSNINAGTSWQALLTFFTPQTVVIGNVLYLSATINNSSCSSLDTLIKRYQQTIVGSFDPNDKSVSPVGLGPYGRIPTNTSELTYTIQFQNTGTYQAQNVRVTDTISNYLDITSLKVLCASANYEVSISGQQVTFQFTNINLPDSNTNEFNSHGYIQYSIKPNNTFVQNNLLQNNADIYFDFNAPIRTNTTRNVADNSVDIASLYEEDLKFIIFPNPATSQLNITIDESLLGAQLNIYDVTGFLIKQEKLKDQSSKLEIQNMPTGVYVAEVKTATGLQKIKWVKM